MSGKQHQGKAHLLILLFIPLLALTIGVMRSVWATLALLAIAGLVIYLLYRPKNSS